MHLMTWTTSSWQAIRKSKQPNSVFSFYLGVVGRLLYNLRRHPKRCSNKCVSLYLCVRQLAGHTKVRQFDFPLFWQQDVGSWKQQRKVGKYSGKVRIIINNIFLVFSLQTILNVTLKLTKTHFCKLGYNLFIHYFIFFFCKLVRVFIVSKTLPLMSLCIFFSECRYSSPFKISLSIVAICISSRAPGSSWMHRCVRVTSILLSLHKN